MKGKKAKVKKLKMVMHIVGNRPQFIKLAPLSKELHRRGYKDIIVHTGQHYDESMSDIFFEELEIAKPEVNLNVGSGSHAETTAKVLLGVEKIVLKYVPDLVILYGDTNSTMAAALACSKLGVAIIHVEAGTRSHLKSNPEEINRILIDHVSEVLFCPDKQSLKNLSKEGLTENIYFSGDIMYDTFLHVKEKGKKEFLQKYEVETGKYILMTWHRQENTNDKERMEEILGFLEQSNVLILFPIHPRTKKMLEKFDLWERINKISKLKIVDPVGYIEMVTLQCNCKLILTDSGGLSKESLYAGVKCLYMMDAVIWPDLEKIGCIRHVFFNNKKSVEVALKLINSASKNETKGSYDFYGNGHTAESIVSILEKKGYITAER